jgi:hypothetical protein
MFILRFSPTRSLGFWLGVHYRQGERFFCFAGFSEVVGLKISDQGIFGGTQRANQFQGVKSEEWK